MLKQGPALWVACLMIIITATLLNVLVFLSASTEIWNTLIIGAYSILVVISIVINSNNEERRRKLLMMFLSLATALTTSFGVLKAISSQEPTERIVMIIGSLVFVIIMIIMYFPYYNMCVKPLPLKWRTPVWGKAECTNGITEEMQAIHDCARKHIAEADRDPEREKQWNKI